MGIIKRKQTGFTIVELLIVIVIIAILAAITIVAYNGIQDRAQDTRLRTAAKQIEKALMRWDIDTTGPPKGGWGSTVAMSDGACIDGSGGWVESTSYVCAASDFLKAGKYIPDNLIANAPPNTEYLASASNGKVSFMFYPCGSSGKYALYWYLKNPTAEDTASITSAISQGCPSNSTYKMKAAKVMLFS